MKRALLLLGAVALLAAGLAAASLAGGASLSQTISTITQTTGGGHTPVTICHKPGTPAEQTLVVDDDSVELTGHLGHGDTLGPCEPVVTTTGTTETTPTDTVPTTPTPPRCPPGEGPYAGKDGQEGNDECCPDSDNNQQCDTPPVPPQDPVVQARPETAPPPAAAPLATTVTVTPLAKAKPKVRVSSVHKTVKAAPKLTGNPKVDKCKDLGDGTMNCKGVVVTQGNG